MFLHSISVVAFVLGYVSVLALAQKAGLPWSEVSFKYDIGQFLTTGKVSWYYSYGSQTVPTSIEFVPQLWGTQQISDWDRTINSTIQQHGVKHVLAFNEPDMLGQANLDPFTAASLWQQHIQPLKAQGILLGSPATFASHTGMQWMQQFLQACVGCTVDFVALHVYTTDAAAVIDTLEQYHNQFQKPVWVTEWACLNFNGGAPACSLQDTMSFMQTTQAFMDSASFVERYAWSGPFGTGTSPDDLLDTEGHIDALGKQYIGA